MNAIRSTDPTVPPTWGEVARRPRWIAALLGVLLVAAVFALLAQWQLGRSVQSVVASTEDFSTPVALDRLDTPGTAVTTKEGGRIVTVSGAFVPADVRVLTDRLRVGSLDPIGGEHGDWLVARFRTSDGATLAVALGYSTSSTSIARAEAALTTETVTLKGRYLPTESPDGDDVEHGQHSALATADLVNRWSVDGPMYDGFLVSGTAPAGLQRIVAPPPEEQTGLNWLNVFYGAEWTLFGGFALYLWYRLVKDVVERETDAANTAAAVG